MKSNPGIHTAGFLAGVLCMVAALPCAALAQDYPNKSITWIAPSSPGGGFDVVSRILAPKMSEILGQSVVVQNIEGAGATIGAAVAAEAAPDGYTILLANANHTAAESLYRNLQYNVIDSFDPIIRFAEIHQLFIANPDIEPKTLPDFIAMAKERPGEFDIAHAGVGSPTHICSKLFQMRAGIDLTDIPYAGGGQALTAVVSGEVDIECALYSASKPFIEDGKVLALAMTSKERTAFAPDIPTVAETIPDFVFLGWFGLVVPKGTPEDVRNKIGAALTEALADPAIHQRLIDLGMEPINQGPEEFAAYIKKEVAETKDLVERAGIQPQ